MWQIQPTPGCLYCVGTGMNVSAVASFHDSRFLMSPLRGVIADRHGQTGSTHHNTHALIPQWAHINSLGYFTQGP